MLVRCVQCSWRQTVGASWCLEANSGCKLMFGGKQWVRADVWRQTVGASWCLEANSGCEVMFGGKQWVRGDVWRQTVGASWCLEANDEMTWSEKIFLTSISHLWSHWLVFKTPIPMAVPAVHKTHWGAVRLSHRQVDRVRCTEEQWGALWSSEGHFRQMRCTVDQWGAL